MDKISCLIILRALFIYLLINSGWTVKKCKEKNSFQMYKTVKK
jgi:hypothetical protein